MARALIDFMREQGHQPDLCLVGEPTSRQPAGRHDEDRRRGSVNIWLEVQGTQGHVAYPHLADNPIPKLVAMLAELDALVLDEGTDWFQPSNLEITEIEVPNDRAQRHPGRGQGADLDPLQRSAFGRLAVRDRSAKSRKARRHSRCRSRRAVPHPAGRLQRYHRRAVKAETGVDPEPSTTGGTSDARFLRSVCPVIEFGLVNATMHKRDEAVAVEDLPRSAGSTRASLGRQRPRGGPGVQLCREDVMDWRAAMPLATTVDRGGNLPKTWFEIPLWQRVITALILGVLVGFVWGPDAESIKWIGDFFIKAIKMLVVPLIFFSLVVGRRRDRRLAQAGRGRRTRAVAVRRHRADGGLARPRPRHA